MTDSRTLDSELAAQRLRNLLKQFALSRTDAAELLRSVAAELEPAAVDAHVRAEAECLRAEGFTVTTDLRIRTHAAARVVGRSAGTLRNWRSAGTGPAWRSEGGVVHYWLPDLLSWRRGELSRVVTITAAGDV